MLTLPSESDLEVAPDTLLRNLARAATRVALSDTSRGVAMAIDTRNRRDFAFRIYAGILPLKIKTHTHRMRNRIK